MILLSQARQNSTRCKSKMIRPIVGDYTLTDLICDKLETLSEINAEYELWDDVAFAVWPGDETIYDIVSSYPNITIIERDESSVSNDPDISRAQIHHYLLDMDCRVQIINSCFPLLSSDLITAIAWTAIRNNQYELLPVIADRDWFFTDISENSKCITNPDMHGTQISTPLYRAFHGSFIFHTSTLKDSGNFFRGPNIHQIDIPSRERLDIDTESDMDICRAMLLHEQITLLMGSQDD